MKNLRLNSISISKINVKYKKHYRVALIIGLIISGINLIAFLLNVNKKVTPIDLFINLSQPALLITSYFLASKNKYKIVNALIMILLPIILTIEVITKNDLSTLYSINLFCGFSFIVFPTIKKSSISYIFSGLLFIVAASFFAKSNPILKITTFTLFNLIMYLVIQYFVCFAARSIYNTLRFKIKKSNVSLTEMNEDLKKMYDLLIEKNNLLESQKTNLSSNNNKEKIHRFLSIISHDVKAPLWSIKNIFDYTKDDKTNKQIVEFIPEIHKTINNTVGLLENLLEWSKNSNNKGQATKEIIVLKPYIENIMDLYILSIKSKNLIVEINCKNDLQIIYEKDVLLTIFRNVLSNAIKYAPINGHVLINCIKIDNQIKFSISNTAFCVNDEQVAYLNGSSSYPVKSLQNEVGSGLGLMIVKDFLENNDTPIIYSNEGNKYITCTITFESSTNNVLKALKKKNILILK